MRVGLCRSYPYLYGQRGCFRKTLGSRDLFFQKSFEKHKSKKAMMKILKKKKNIDNNNNQDSQSKRNNNY